MPTATITGDPKRGGIPKGSTVVIHTLPDNREVRRFEGASDRVSLELDPGFYSYTINGPYLPEVRGMTTYSGAFVHALTPEQSKKIVSLRPRLASSMMTTDGPRWTCNIMGCGERFTSHTAAALHEGEHYGVDLLADPRAQQKIAFPKQGAQKPGVADPSMLSTQTLKPAVG